MENSQAKATVSLYLKDEEDTQTLGRLLAPLLAEAGPDGRRGGRLHLRGDLGAGKTSFARALLRAVGVKGRIRSPSYALLESYNVSSLYCYHLDFYRFQNPREWLDAGFREMLDSEAIVLIEWPEQAQGLLPPPDLELAFEYAGQNGGPDASAGRLAHLSAYSNKGTLWLTKLAPALQTFVPRDGVADA